MYQWKHASRWLSGGIALVVLLLAGCAPAGGATPAGQAASPTGAARSLAHLTVYATSDTGSVRALRAASGQLRWQGQTGTISGGKPVVDNGIVYVGSNGMVYAFASSTGSLLWSAPIGQAPRGPLVVGGVVFGTDVISDANVNQTIFVKALRGSSGAPLWRAQVNNTPVAFPGLLGLFVANGVVYVAVAESAAASGQTQFFLSAYQAGDGHLLWHAPATHPDQGAGIGLVVDDHAVYVYVDRVYAYDRGTGALLWSSQQASATLSNDPNSVALQQGILYVSATDGVSAYRTSDGSRLWQYAGAGLAMTLTDGVVYASAQGIVALDGQTGKLLWHYQPSQRENFFPLLVGGGLVYGVKEQTGIVALDAASGKLRWQSPAGGNGNAPVLVANTLFVGAFQSGSWGYAALNASDGALLWTMPISEGITFPSALTVEA